MTSPAPSSRSTRGRRRGRRLLPCAALVVTSVAGALSASVPPAGARAAAPRLLHPAKVVVKVVDVPGFGMVLESKKGLPLYVDTAPPCTGSCLTIWPPLLMPKNKTIPLGASNLGTVAFGTALQVTYNGKPLYSFFNDTKRHPPTGNGVEFFAVVTVG